MKKVLLLLIILVAVLGITACNPFHTHTGNGEYTIVKEPTCTENGESQMLCSECGKVAVTVPVPATGHTEVIIPMVEQTCTATGLTEGKYCSVCGILLVKPSVIDKHHFVDFICSDCGEVYVSKGLYYRSYNNGTCSIAGIGTCTDTDVSIPSISPDGDTVTSISSNAFISFSDTDSLTSVLIPDSVTNIGMYAFNGCSSLKNLTIPDSVTQIDYGAFAGCTSLTNVTIGNSITVIAERAFFACLALNNITIPDSVRTIDNEAFYGCESLVSLTIPSSVSWIKTSAFHGCESLTTINYEGTVEQWENFSKDDMWNHRTGNYTIYCIDGEIAKNGTVTYYEAYVRDGDFIYFGEYPQTIKADDVTITETQDSRGYYLGSDGSYYAKVTATPYESGYKFSTGSTVTSGIVYYFKVEPIRWRILSEENGEAFLLCDSIIDNHVFYDCDYWDYPSGDAEYYIESDIREWLTTIFYETAFGSLQQSRILTTKVDNSMNSGMHGGWYDWDAEENEYTYDKIFMLSHQEISNTSFGFATNTWEADISKTMLTSDYSRAIGVWMYSTSSDYYGNGQWWLRTPYNDDSPMVCFVYQDGRLSSGSSPQTGGVVPALRIRL